MRFDTVIFYSDLFYLSDCQIMNTRNGKQENIRAGQLRNILRKTSESKTGQEINRGRSSTTTTKNNTKKNNNTEPPRTAPQAHHNAAGATQGKAS